MKLLREPLLHFLLAGGLLFAVYGWLDRSGAAGAGRAERTLQVSAGEVDWLVQGWSRQWQRAPNPGELDEIVASYLKEALLAREARALGLDENDTVVRRRLAQKMEFLLLDTLQVAEPDDDELRRFHDRHRDRFATAARVSFTHLYFSRERRGALAEADARAALQRLSQGQVAAQDAGEFGDRFIAQLEFADADEAAVAGVLGPAFAHRLFELDAGAWQGPVESAFGLHLVRIAHKQTAMPREWAAVKAVVLDFWRQQQAQQARERYFAALLRKYEFVADDRVKALVATLSAPRALATEPAR